MKASVNSSGAHKTKMRGVWLQNQRMAYRTDLAVPTPLEQEALVKVRLAGICATDLDRLKRRQIDPLPLIQEILDFGQIATAVELAKRPGSMQILLAAR